jgi:hypothetical protein
LVYAFSSAGRQVNNLKAAVGSEEMHSRLVSRTKIIAVNQVHGHDVSAHRPRLL